MVISDIDILTGVSFAGSVAHFEDSMLSNMIMMVDRWKWDKPDSVDFIYLEPSNTI